MYWLMELIFFLKIGSRQQEASRPSDATWELDAHCTRAVPRGTAAPRFFPPIRGSLMSTKLQSQGMHRITLVGAERQNSVDFRQGVLGIPLTFEQPNLDRPEPS